MTMGKKTKIQRPEEMQKRCMLQGRQWARIDALVAEIRKLSDMSSAIGSKADKQLRDTIETRLREMKAERDTLLAEIEADRQRLARRLISTLFCADLTASVFDRFGDDCRKIAESNMRNDYVELGKEACQSTWNAVEKVLGRTLDRWNDVVTCIDEPNDMVVSCTFAELSQQFSEEAMRLVEKYESKIKNSYTAYF